MAPDASADNLASNWHTIRPWSPSLSLAVREITSVSAAFILSCGEIDSSLASIGMEAADEDAEGNDGEGVSTKTSSVIADALAKGLSVNVNGSAWPRAFIRIDDQLDEAVIIIYALMPGRQYDIELGLAPAGQPATSVCKQVTTEEESDHDTSEVHTDPESLTQASDTPSTSPSGTVPGTPPPPITLEDRLNQLQHTLSAVNSERETLLASLKTARRDAQKADSALRSEIDTLKRTSEKNAAAELRGKQKILALQEAVKRAQNATKETEELAEEVKHLEPDLYKRKQEKEVEHAKIKRDADRVRKEREDIEEKERKRIEGMKSELAGLTSKLEKLNGKQEKLEGTTIPDLEEKLKEIEAEIEREEQEIPLQRLQLQAPIGRPTPLPIQRPDQNLWSPPRSNSYQSQRRASLKSNTLPSSTPSSASLASTKSSPSNSSHNSSPTHTNAGPMTTSTLSSRAPAFEPSRTISSLKGHNGHSPLFVSGQPSNFPTTPSPVARSRPTGSAGPGRSSSGGSVKSGVIGQGHGQWMPHGHGHGQGHGGFDSGR
ncbi:hypothetical protein BDN70DRAFT_825002 [Pholiota conissans]|uniref:Uncharacterized protein n=1 Tax=Pholiota conissans TaxID=109636 RepID=A0A9P5ZCB5_9AGAR|nr:hypothetical protein BDN70DRAFT_825002 [Pholiota conissans]